MMKQKKEWNIELHEFFESLIHEHNLKQSEVLSYLSNALMGTMAMCQYSDEFAKKTFDRLYQKFLEKKKELNEK